MVDLKQKTIIVCWIPLESLNLGFTHQFRWKMSPSIVSKCFERLIYFKHENMYYYFNSLVVLLISRCRRSNHPSQTSVSRLSLHLWSEIGRRRVVRWTLSDISIEGLLYTIMTIILVTLWPSPTYVSRPSPNYFPDYFLFFKTVSDIFL